MGVSTFSGELPLHFHIFPRTRNITSEFIKKYPEQKDLIHGPVLLDWARAVYKYDEEKVWSIVSPIVLEMKKCITTPSSGSLTASRFAPT